MRYASLAALDRPFDDVYISPHLDDVALSCGGRILRERALGRSVLVVTVFTADAGPCREIPPHVRARVGDMTERRREDERAMARLGVDCLWLDHPEAIFRDRAYHTLLGALSRLAASDREWIARLASEFELLVERVCPGRLYCPLGVGHHADHRVVFEAALLLVERWSERTTVADRPRNLEVCFYEDAPYALIPSLVEHRLDMVRARSLREEAAPSRSIWARAREAHATMMTLSSVRAEVGHVMWRAATRGFLIFQFARGKWASRRARPRLWLIPELCEIGDVLTAKLDVLAEYRSQIVPVLGDLQSYVRLRLAYSQRLLVAPSARSNAPPDREPTPRVLERVWRIARLESEASSRERPANGFL
ncbi:hypothetical protein HRbin08_01285 [bacterium HR08]|nr:hypothetical protein HRbin08_01285 [bacterium HR08]